MHGIKDEIIKMNYKNIIIFIFSLAFSSSLIFGNNVNFNGDFYSKYSDIIFSKITIPEIILFVLFSVIIYVLIIVVNKKVYSSYLFTENKKRILTRKNYFIIWILIIISWIPYLLTYYPGGVFSDAFTSWNQALFLKIDNHHTLLYSYYLSVFAHIGKILNNFNIAIFLYTIIQYLIMSFILTYVIAWLYDKQIKKVYLVITLLLFMFYPLFPYYAIAVWKDTYFSLALLLYILFIIDYLIGKKKLKEKKNLFQFIILSFFVCFLRNNGIYIVSFVCISFIILKFKEIKKNKLFIVTDLIFIIITLLIQGPLYNKMGLSTEKVESISIPMQQIGAIITNNKYINDDVKAISRVWNIDEVKEKYTPFTADTMKWYINSFNANNLSKYSKEVTKEWLYLVVKNPDIAIKSYLYETLSFWNFRYNCNIAYIQEGVWENFYNVKQTDYFNKIFGFSFSNIVRPQKFISPGMLFWIIMLFAMIAFKKVGFKSLIAYSPIIGAWLTIMVATPVAFSLRYMYILVLFIPISYLIPQILSNGDNNLT